jgi:hypothetical protein
LTAQTSINPVHVALLRTGKVLIVAGSGNVATEKNFQAAVWDPQFETFSMHSNMPWDMFCNGMVTLPDGRVFINGGNLQYDPFFGEPRNAVFDPENEFFSDVENMANGRWYPTTTVLGDGRILTFSGLGTTGGTNQTTEIYTVGSGWSAPVAAGWNPPLYPRMHLSTDGRVFFAGPGRQSRFFNPATNTWTLGPLSNYTGSRSYGTSVLLPLTPANGFKPRVMIFGGGNAATNTTEIIDLSAPTAWQYGPPMTQARVQMSATILPSGKVLTMGGSSQDENAAFASLRAELYDPAANLFTPAGSNVYPRLYHSASVLLPDATVLLLGGNPQRGNYEPHLEIYSPAYLFNLDGSAATRPTITGAPTGTIGFGSQFQVQTPQASQISSVVLVRPGAATHAFDMDQRLVGLSFTAGSGVLNVTAPAHGNIAPPGYYMLFVLNSAGVPSVARFVRIDVAPNQPPVATIDSPTGNVTVNPGGSVSFAGHGNDSDGTISSYAWTFPGGTPASSSLQNPGAVSYATPGSYAATLTVTDNRGATSAPATRTITVSDFTLTATPSSRTVLPGGSTTYTVTVNPVNGFTGTVNFNVTGLPSGATGTFNPTSVTTSGSTTLTVTTTGATAPGSYPLTIHGTSGPRTRTSSATLVVDNAPSGQAVYDSGLRAPRCPAVGSVCDSGPSLLNGRDGLGPEPNQPNTIGAMCTDGTDGAYHIDESIDQLRVSTLDGSSFAAGKNVRLEATVWAWTTPSEDKLDLYYAANANSPSWQFIATLTPSAAGAQTLSATYTLPSGTLQAVRARFRYQGAATACGTGPYNDHDDLIFPVAAPPPDSQNPTTAITAPQNGASVSATFTIAASANDNVGVSRVEFYVDGVLRGTDTTAPYSYAWDTTTFANGTHSIFSRAFDFASNVGTSATVTVDVNNQTAIFDSVLRAPKCGTVAGLCDSGALLNGRDGIGPEPNQPNTINGSCVDRTVGSYHVDESIDRIRVFANNGSSFAAGTAVTVEATVWAWTTPSEDKLELYAAANANNPSWQLIATLTPAAAGAQTLSTTFTLPAGTLQAVRARFHYQGAAGACGTGDYDDHDDLIFAVR